MEGRTTTVASVVIPAHNEAAVISACLDALLADAGPGEFEICVVSNGSDDDTASVARSRLATHPSAAVVELPESSKIAALRAGNRHCRTYPRLYLDADISLSTAAARAVVDELTARSEPAVAAPRLSVDTAASSRMVRGYYRAWTALPYVSGGVIGSGVYAVNAAGGSRLGEFPDVVNDDGWVRQSFAPAERHSVDVPFVVRPPRTARALVARRARIVVGNDAIGAGSGATGGLRAVSRVVRDRRASTPDALCYLGITASSRLLGRWRRWRGHGNRWSTDLTSRLPNR